MNQENLYLIRKLLILFLISLVALFSVSPIMEYYYETKLNLDQFCEDNGGEYDSDRTRCYICEDNKCISYSMPKINGERRLVKN